MKCVECVECGEDGKQTETYKEIPIYECINGHRFGFIKEKPQVQWSAIETLKDFLKAANE